MRGQNIKGPQISLVTGIIIPKAAVPLIGKVGTKLAYTESFVHTSFRFKETRIRECILQ